MKKFFTGTNIRIFLHLLAWSILLGLPLYFVKRWQIGSDFLWLYYLNTIISGVIFYINYFVLVPKFFFSRKNHRYYISVIILLALFYFITDKSNGLVFRYVSDNHNESVVSSDKQLSHDERKMPALPGPGRMFVRPPFRQMHLYNYGFTSLFLIFFSIGLRVIERHSKTEKLQEELEKEKLNSELAFLKNQISPHFFFNTLNNIYSLISINAEDSQKAVLKLSKLMRYMLYDSEQGNTHLSNEIDFMNNYIDLMKLRMSEKISLKVSFPEKFEDITIPPLLFVPFIENAFKHGISYRESSFIDITLSIDQNSITFICKNSIIRSREETEANHSGIGLENVTKRLNLLFQNKHTLKINKAGTVYEVVLNIIFT